MAYLTQQQFIDRLTLPKVLWLVRSSTLNTTQVSAAITDAEAAVNEFATGSTGFPWVTVPPQATECTFAITRAYLWDRNWIGQPRPLDIAEGYRAAKAQLSMLRDRKVTWVSSEPPGVTQLAEAFVSLPNEAPVHTNTRLNRLGKLRKIF